MSEEKKIDTAPESDGVSESGEETLSPELQALLAEYRAEMDDLYESRRRRAEAYANMTEEEIVASMTADLEAVLADALENGMDIITVGDDEEDGEEEEDGGEA